MINYILKKIIGTQNERALQPLRLIVEDINAFEPEVSRLSDEQLKSKTDEFRTRIAQARKDHQDELSQLDDAYRDSTSPDEKEKIKRKARDAKNRIFEGVLGHLGLELFRGYVDSLVIFQQGYGL